VLFRSGCDDNNRKRETKLYIVPLSLIRVPSYSQKRYDHEDIYKLSELKYENQTYCYEYKQCGFFGFFSIVYLYVFVRRFIGS